MEKLTDLENTAGNYRRKKRKLNSFKIIKFSSASIKRRNFKIEVDINSIGGVNDGFEVIKLGENQLIYTIQKIRGRRTDFSKVEKLEKKIKDVGRRKNSEHNRELIQDARRQINGLTFIPEIVSVQFGDSRHYKNIIDSGLTINGKEYIRCVAGAGAIRRNTIYFIDKEIYPEVMRILNCGRDLSVELNPAKFSAYLGLYSSAGYDVSKPDFAVVPDYLYKRMGELNWLDDSTKRISPRNKEIELNVFDGQGLISPYWSGVWADELGLDYLPSTYIFRAPFAKGQLVTFDFHKMAQELEIYTCKDVWGNEFNIEDVDVILSQSQFKLWDSYPSCSVYSSMITLRDLNFSISRYSHEKLRNDTTSNYMFLQVLDLGDGSELESNIELLADETLKYFCNVQYKDPLTTALYLSGPNAFHEDFDKDDFERLDVMTKAILIYPELMNEKYISDRIANSLQKRMKEAKLGKLFFRGNYVPMVSDPYAQAEWILGKTPKGLLGEGEHYSKYWTGAGEEFVAGGRSPLTHNSEMCKFELVDREELRMWYQYQDTSFIFSIFGLDTLYLADADFDGDLIFTTNHNIFSKCRVPDFPIAYEHGKARKESLSDDKIIEADLSGFNSKIGFITNVSSSLHCMKYDFPKDSPERLEIEHRLKMLRVYQGEEIDRAKNGGVKREVPESWTSYDKGMEDALKPIIANRRPYFTRHLYDNYDKKYRGERDKYNKYSWSHFGKSFDDLLQSLDRTPDEERCVNNYYKYSFFIFSDSPMNEICRYVENQLDKIDNIITPPHSDFDYKLLLSPGSTPPDKSKLKDLLKYYVKYNAAKKASRSHPSDIFRRDLWNIIYQIEGEILAEVSSNSTELGDLGVYLLIQNKRTASFVWEILGKYIVDNLMNRYVSGGGLDILVQDENGDVEFLFNKFSKRNIFLGG